MERLLIPIGIMVGLSILSWLVQKMKTASDRAQVKRERERQRTSPTERPQIVSPTQRAPTSDVDRFMAEINRLRERAGNPQPNRPIPTVRPAPQQPPRRQRVSETVAPAFPGSSGDQPSRSVVTAPTRLDDPLPVATVVGTAPRELPVATVVSTPVKQVEAAAATVTAAPIVKSSMVQRKKVQTSPIGIQLAAMLANPQATKMAIILQEVLGPPKCKRG